MGHESWHEPYESLSTETRDMHRAIISLMEELEAIDWYQQRADVTPDAELKTIMEHNRDEEIEHASMTLEWIRRRNPKFDENLRTYLFSEGPITAVEEAVTAGAAATLATPPKESIERRALPRPPPPERSSDGSLGIGSLAIARGA